MDPLEQRLTDAGETWRQAQPAPIDVSPVLARLDRDRRPGLSVGRVLGSLTAAAALLIVVVVAILIAPRQQAGGPIASATAGPTGATSATSGNSAPPGNTAPPPDTTADLSDRYADGIPRTFGNAHVYRPNDALKDPPAGEFLLGGWDAGALPVSCPQQQAGASVSCPGFVGGAEAQGGASVIPMSWDGYAPSGYPAFVVRAIATPALACLSVPAGSCPGPGVRVVEPVWFGDPASDKDVFPNGPPEPSAAPWWSGREGSYCTSPAAYRLHGTVTWLGNCMGLFVKPVTESVALTVGDRLDVHLFEGAPAYTVPGTTNGEVIDIGATTDPSTVTYVAKAAGTASLITFGLCLEADPAQASGAEETNGPCPVLDVKVVPAP